MVRIDWLEGDRGAGSAFTYASLTARGRPGHRAPRVRFGQELEEHLSDAAAEETLDAVVDWGRYADIFAYDDQTEMFSLEDPKG
jgi:hypothetical protein